MRTLPNALLGPDSPGVVDLARRLGASSVRGNHEDKVLLTAAEVDLYHDPAAITPFPDSEEPTSPIPSFPEGEPTDIDVDVNATATATADPTPETTRRELSLSTKDSKVLELAKSFNKEQRSWLQSCPVILRIGEIGKLHNVVVVHAGLVPDIPLDEQDPYHVMNMRTIDLNTRLPSETRAHTPWEKFWNHQQQKKPAEQRMTVIYGHDRKRGKNIQKYSMGLDSGCVGGGQLTAMVIEEGGKHHFAHVKCKGYVD